MMLMCNFFKDLYTENSLPPTLYSIMEAIVNFDNPNQVKIKDLAKESRNKIFDFEYPISEALGKEKFEELFLKHYMFRRINYDTVLAFKLHLEVKLNDIMPKYNKMMEGFNLLAFDGTVETHERVTKDNRTTNEEKTSTGTNSISATNTDNISNQVKFSETPQNQMSDVSSGSYVSEFTDTSNNSSGTSSSSSNSSNTDNREVSDNLETNELITIKHGDSIDEYKKYLEVASSIYEMIFKECDSLFYGIL